MTAQKKQSRGKSQGRYVYLDAGPFRGMQDSLDPLGNYDPTLADLLQNVYSPNAQIESAVVGRPGFTQAGVRLGSAGKRTGQIVGQFTKLSGTDYTFAIVGGQFYTYNWGTDTWTEVVTAANFTTATITLSQTAICYALTFADKLFISDGVNTPWTWDGTAGAGGLTKLTNCPVLYGQPVVYYAQVFGIKASARSTIVWSEVNDPTIGYDTGTTYDDSWQLGQTDQDALTALSASNQALYYFRSRSIGVIQGSPGAIGGFRASGVHDSVSGITGTESPNAVLYFEGGIFFLDADFLPFAIVPGSGLAPLWPDIRQTIFGMDRQYTSQAISVYDESTKLVLLSMVEQGQTISSVQIAIDPLQGAGQIAAVWRGYTFQQMASVKNATGRPVLMHLSDDGYAYAHGHADGSTWSDGLNSGTVAISHLIRPTAMGADLEYELHYDRLDLNLRAQTDVTNLVINQETSRGLSVATIVPAPAVVGLFSRWDSAIWDTDLWSSASLDQHVAIGLDGVGRWIKPIVSHATLGEEFGLATIRVTALPMDNDPSVP